MHRRLQCHPKMQVCVFHVMAKFLVVAAGLLNDFAPHDTERWNNEREVIDTFERRHWLGSRKLSWPKSKAAHRYRPFSGVSILVDDLGLAMDHAHRWMLVQVVDHSYKTARLEAVVAV